MILEKSILHPLRWRALEAKRTFGRLFTPLLRTVDNWQQNICCVVFLLVLDFDANNWQIINKEVSIDHFLFKNLLSAAAGRTRGLIHKGMLYPLKIGLLYFTVSSRCGSNIKYTDVILVVEGLNNDKTIVFDLFCYMMWCK